MSGFETLAQPSSIRTTNFMLRNGSDTWTTQPQQFTEFLGSVNRRVQVDLSGYAQVRLVAGVPTPGGTAATLGVQYSVDSGSTWANFDGTANTDVGAPSVDYTGSGSPKASASWQAIPTEAQTDIQIRIVGNVSSSASPAFSYILLQAK
jgi:hypothetical protein